MTTFSLVATLTAALCVVAVLGAVWVDFRRYGGRSNTQREKRSPVATGTMLLFFLVYYLVLRLEVGVWTAASYGLRIWEVSIGLVFTVGGTAVNLWGRAVLGRNWANHIKIYQNHTLVTTGPFRYVRHPLYSSLILMAFGGCLLYSNWLGAVLTGGVFIPMMHYRAGQEEQLLERAFPDYETYKKVAGRFFPLTLKGAKGLPNESRKGMEKSNE